MQLTDMDSKALGLMEHLLHALGALDDVQGVGVGDNELIVYMKNKLPEAMRMIEFRDVPVRFVMARARPAEGGDGQA